MCNATWYTFGAGRAGRRIATAIGVAMALLSGSLTPPSIRAAAATVSASGNQAPLWITVSPNYAHSHMVAALAAEMGCSAHCMHLRVSRDGGGTWRDSRLPFDAAHVAVLTNGSAREAVLVEAKDATEQTDDDGATWRPVGPAGIPVNTGQEVALVAVRGGQDFEVTPWKAMPVAGSGQAETDLSFAASSLESSELLSVADPNSGADLVERCDPNFRCSYPVPLPGGRSPDVSVVLDSAFATDGVALARTPTALYRSTNGGVTFAPVTLPAVQSAAYTTVAAVSTAPVPRAGHDSIYVALLGLVHAGSTSTTAGGVFRSDDLGGSWHTVDGAGPLRDGATAVAAAPDGRLFAGYVNSAGQAGLVCSADGERWAATCAPITAACTGCGDASPSPGAGGGQTTAGSGPSGSSSESDAATAGGNSVAGAGATSAGGETSRFYVFLIAVVISLGVVVVPLSTLRRRSP